MHLPLRLIEARSSTAVRETVTPASTDLDHDFRRTLAAIGGLAARSRIHALHPARHGDEGAATGFALTLLAQLADQAGLRQGVPRHPLPILWVQDRRARLEAGLPYALGLSRLGIAPSQIVLITTKTAFDALAATEIGLEAGGLDGVIAELPANLPADMLALGKRLALRAEKSATPCLLLHASPTPVPAPVATRWQIASRAAISQQAWAPSLAAVDLTLVKNRFGPTGRWSASLQPASHAYGVSDVRVPRLTQDVSSPFSEPVDAAAAHRPGAPPSRSNAA